MNNKTFAFKLLKDRRIIAIICLSIIIALAVIVHPYMLNPAPLNIKNDIYYLWLDGNRLLSGENPYERVLSGDWRWNKKYSTYFPLFYILSYLTQLAGLDNYLEWLGFWRKIFLLFNIGIVSVIFLVFYQSRMILLAVLTSLFWLFNRWTLLIVRVDHIDFIPLFFLVLSLLVIRKSKWASLLFFSISLAIKQFAVFLIPIYLIWIWQKSDTNKAKEVLIATIVILSVPVVTSLPFLFWNAPGFIKSILFSATRNPEGNSIDSILGFVGIRAKFIMFLLLTLTYSCIIRYKLPILISSLFTISTFVGFNSVYFPHYLIWIFPFVPLAFIDILFNQKENNAENYTI